MYAAVCIRSYNDASPSVRETLDKLRLRQTNACMLYQETDSMTGMLRKAKDFIAYGEIEQSLLERLLKRAFQHNANGDVLQALDYTTVSDVASALLNGEISIENLQQHGLQLPLRLNNPSKGFRAIRLGVQQGGALGYHGTAVNELLKRMI